MADTDDLFRKEALAAWANPHGDGGALLELSPRWLDWSYRLLVIVCASAVAYSLVGTVREYASGPALVRARGRLDVTAHAGGTVDQVAVRPGQRVRSGEIIATLHPAAEQAELSRIRREFELSLVKALRDPGDVAARQSLTALRAQRELAEARLGERAIRAPRAGVVSDVRIHGGQLLAPGDIVASLLAGDEGFEVVAVLPGSYRPLLRPGMTLRLEVVGFPYAYQKLLIDSVADEVVGPAEVRRYLGPGVGDTVATSGALVLVHARLPSPTFTVDGRSLAYFDGMQGRAEAAVREHSILVTILPGLRALLARERA